MKKIRKLFVLGFTCLLSVLILFGNVEAYDGPDKASIDSYSVRIDKDSVCNYGYYGWQEDQQSWGTGETGYFRVSDSDGNNACGICIDPHLPAPNDGEYEISSDNVYDNKSLLSKALYYGYGGVENRTIVDLAFNDFEHYSQVQDDDADCLIMTHIACAYIMRGQDSYWSIAGPVSEDRHEISDQAKEAVLRYVDWLSEQIIPDDYYSIVINGGASFQDVAYIVRVPKYSIKINKISNNKLMIEAEINQESNAKKYNLKGAEYGIYKSRQDAVDDASRIASIFIDENNQAVSPRLESDIYYIREVKGPDNGLYLINKEIIELDLNQDQELILKEDAIDFSLDLIKKASEEDGDDSKYYDKYYSLKGAKYGLFIDPACEKRASYIDEIGNLKGQVEDLVTDENGRSQSIKNIRPGVYYLKELSPPLGFKINTEIIRIDCNLQELGKINQDSKNVEFKSYALSGIDFDSDGQCINYHLTCRLKDQRIDRDLNFELIKQDASTGGKVCNAGLSLAGAVFELSYYGDDESRQNKISSIELVSDQDGYLTNSDIKYYKNPAEYAARLEMGYYSIKEVKAPYAYDVNDTIYEFEAFSALGEDKAQLRGDIIAANEEGSLYRISKKGSLDYVDEKPLYGGIEIEKIDNTSMSSDDHLLGTSFEIINDTGFDIITADNERFKNGHTIEIVEVEKVGDRCLARTRPDLLPFGKYKVRELKASTGYELNENEYCLLVNKENAYSNTDLEGKPLIIGNDRKKPEIKTSAFEILTGAKKLEPKGQTQIIDKVVISGLLRDLDDSDRYFIKAELYEKDSDDSLAKAVDKALYSSQYKEVKVDDSGQASLDVAIDLDLDHFAGKSLVVYERLYRASDARIIKPENMVAQHCDINDANQTIELIKPELPNEPLKPADLTLSERHDYDERDYKLLTEYVEAGDTSLIILWCILLAVSLSVLVITLMRNKEKH